MSTKHFSLCLSFCGIMYLKDECAVRSSNEPVDFFFLYFAAFIWVRVYVFLLLVFYLYCFFFWRVQWVHIFGCTGLSCRFYYSISILHGMRASCQNRQADFRTTKKNKMHAERTNGQYGKRHW